MRRHLTDVVAGQVLKLKLDDLDLVLEAHNELAQLLRIHIHLINLIFLGLVLHHHASEPICALRHRAVNVFRR